MPDIAIVNELLNTEHILSYLLVLLMVGGGRWFVRQGWSDLLSYLHKREETRLSSVQVERERNLEEVRLSAESRLAMAKQFENLSRAFFELAGEVKQNNVIQQTMVNLLVHILERLNGKSVTEILTEKGVGS